MVVKSWEASGESKSIIPHDTEGVVRVSRRLVRIYADVENALGMPPEKLIEHVSERIGSPSNCLAFLAKRNRLALEGEWRESGFQVCIAGDGPDGADRRLITHIVHDIQLDSENGRPPGTIILVATGDGVYKDVLKVAERLGWHTIVIGWGSISKALQTAAHESVDLAAVTADG